MNSTVESRYVPTRRNCDFFETGTSLQIALLILLEQHQTLVTDNSCRPACFPVTSYLTNSFYVLFQASLNDQELNRSSPLTMTSVGYHVKIAKLLALPNKLWCPHWTDCKHGSLNTRCEHTPLVAPTSPELKFLARYVNVLSNCAHHFYFFVSCKAFGQLVGPDLNLTAKRSYTLKLSTVPSTIFINAVGNALVSYRFCLELLLMTFRLLLH